MASAAGRRQRPCQGLQFFIPDCLISKKLAVSQSLSKAYKTNRKQMVLNSENRPFQKPLTF